MVENAVEAEFEKRGYDDWIDLWVRFGCSPSVGQCPARYMQPGPKRSAYLRGWVRAKDENAK